MMMLCILEMLIMFMTKKICQRVYQINYIVKSYILFSNVLKPVLNFRRHMNSITMCAIMQVGLSLPYVLVFEVSLKQKNIHYGR